MLTPGARGTVPLGGDPPAHVLQSRPARRLLLRMFPLLASGLLATFISSSLLLSVAGQGQPSLPKRSSSAIAITPDGASLLVVNPDSNSLTIVDTASRAVVAELPVGVDPRAVAVSPDGARAYVANQGSDSVSVVEVAEQRVDRTIAVGDRPVGVAVSADGRLIAVSELGDDRVRILDARSLTTLTLAPVADRPHGLTFAPDGRLLVTHLLSGDVTVLTLQPYGLYLPALVRGGLAARVATQTPPGASHASLVTRHLSLATVRSLSATISTWPNVAPAPAVVVNSAGTRAYLPQTMAHGQGLNTQFDTTVFPKVSVLDMETSAHQRSEHISLPEKDTPVGLPWDVALARNDSELWVVNSASNDVSVLDVSDPLLVRRSAHIPVGYNPRGIVLDPSGGTAYVNNTLAGTVSVIDARAYTVTAVITTTEVPLPPVLLNGKRLFFSSARPELSRARWISCNTCHIEGEQDGRTWLLQYTGEVPPGSAAVITRNTTSLLGMIETYPLRWSAEWDESADSEFSIRFEQFGMGLIPGGMNPTLGPPNQGRAWDLDCLASYIDSVQAPQRTRALTPIEERGRALFESARTGCSLCHAAPLYTDLKQHDVGTAGSYGEWFGPRIDTPTLRSLYDSAPYLHDGSAATLRDILTTANPQDAHGRTSQLTSQEVEELAVFLAALSPTEGESGFTYQASACLGTAARAPGTVEIRVEGRDIVMEHLDAAYNCCAQVAVYLEDARPLFKLIEQEEYPDGPACRCLCAHNLGARIANVPPGRYRVEVWNGAVNELLAKFEVTVQEQSNLDSWEEAGS